MITILLLGSLYLLFYFVTLSSYHIVPEEEFEIEYAIEELILDEDIAEITKGKIKIETHQVYSKAEEFIKESEANSKENSEAIEDKLSEINDVISDSKSERIAISLEKKPQKKDANTTNLESTLATNNNSKSTNSYRLINRKVIEFLNPVYICESFGKIVLQIEVNANGYVIMTSVKKNTSTTTNLCLIESAINNATKKLVLQKIKTSLLKWEVSRIFFLVRNSYSINFNKLLAIHFPLF